MALDSKDCRCTTVDSEPLAGQPKIQNEFRARSCRQRRQARKTHGEDSLHQKYVRHRIGQSTTGQVTSGKIGAVRDRRGVETADRDEDQSRENVPKREQQLTDVPK